MSRHHQLLGVPAEATREQIRSAFRKKARELHPDVNSDGASAFEEVLAAYRALLACPPASSPASSSAGSPAGTAEPIVTSPAPWVTSSPVPGFVAATYRRYGGAAR